MLLSGPICCGKSSLADLLEDRYSAVRLKTNVIIEELDPSVKKHRKSLQSAGERLDRKTNGEWVCNALIRHDDQLAGFELVIVDAVRIREQIWAIRRAYGSRVTHIHLKAADEELRKRYKSRKGSISEFDDYEKVRKSATEKGVGALEDIADVVIKTDRCTELDVLVRVSAHLGLYPRSLDPVVDVMIGGQYGSEGKGNIAAHIAPEYDYLVRVGGPNAGHKVYGKPVKTFHHLPSGTDRCEAKVLLGPGAVINPESLIKEIAMCQLSQERLAIDPQAMIISPSDISTEVDELQSTISSTAQGVGRAEARRINERGVDEDGQKGCVLARDVDALKGYVQDTKEILDHAFSNGEKVLIEGTQGTSLSLYHGEYPYVTSRDTTVSGCLAQSGVAPKRVRRVLMVCRTYPIRVGGPSGPMSQQIPLTQIAKRAGLNRDSGQMGGRA